MRNATEIAASIERVENGLLGPVSIAGQAARRSQLAQRMRELQVPGASIAVINNGTVEWARGYGVAEAGTNRPVSATTMFQAASISKIVSAAGILTLVQQGKLELDSEVNKRLVSWKIPDNELTKGHPVTLRQLLSHTAGTTVPGFRGYSAAEPLPTVQAILNGEKPSNSAPVLVDTLPGTKFRYSGGGYTVAQLLAGDVTGLSYARFMETSVLAPLKMQHSTFAQPLPAEWQASAASGHDQDGVALQGKWHTYPTQAAAGLWSTPTDLAGFTIALQRAHAGNADGLLSQSLATVMLTPVLNNYGLGTMLTDKGSEGRFSHSGGNAGFRTMLVGYAGKGQGAVILTNSDSGMKLIEELLRSISAEYRWNDYKIVEHALGRADTALFPKYIGDFRDRNRVFKITSRDTRLFVQEESLGAQPLELLPESNNKFFALEADITFAFVPKEDGTVDEVSVQYFGTRKAIREKL
jgi:CubicO group peptidase (beta-lactamase class C family)